MPCPIPHGIPLPEVRVAREGPPKAGLMPTRVPLVSYDAADPNVQGAVGTALRPPLPKNLHPALPEEGNTKPQEGAEAAFKTERVECK